MSDKEGEDALVQALHRFHANLETISHLAGAAQRWQDFVCFVKHESTTRLRQCDQETLRRVCEENAIDLNVMLGRTALSKEPAPFTPPRRRRESCHARNQSLSAVAELTAAELARLEDLQDEERKLVEAKETLSHMLANFLVIVTTPPELFKTVETHLQQLSKTRTSSRAEALAGADGEH